MTDHASSMPSTSTRRTSGWIRCRVPSAAPAPEYSRSGATTTTSPSGRMAPGEHVQPDGVDAVVVGQQQPGQMTGSDGRVVPIGSDLRT